MLLTYSTAGRGTLTFVRQETRAAMEVIEMRIILALDLENGIDAILDDINRTDKQNGK